MQTINSYLQKYIEVIFRELGLADKVKPETVTNVIEVIQRETIADLMEKELSESQIQEFMISLESAEDKTGKSSNLIKLLGEETEIRDKIISKANDLIFRFLDTLKEDGSITEGDIGNLYNFLNDPKKISEIDISN